MRPAILTLLGAVLSSTLGAQAPATPSAPTAPMPAVAFDVVSIKRNLNPQAGGGARTTPDGGQVMTNVTIRQFITAAAPGPVREVVGLPAWADAGGEHYDVAVKPPAGSTPDDHRLMWHAMFAERMKLKAHIEEREETIYALVIARSDGRLGPQLKPSPLDCARPPAVPHLPLPDSATLEERIAVKMRECGALFGQGVIAVGGMRLTDVVRSLRGLVGGEVRDQTGLPGFYAFTIKFTSPRGGVAPKTTFNDAPDIFTAFQEQLGLKLRPEKGKVAILVVDHIERPTEN